MREEPLGRCVIALRSCSRRFRAGARFALSIDAEGDAAFDGDAVEDEGEAFAVFVREGGSHLDPFGGGAIAHDLVDGVSWAGFFVRILIHCSLHFVLVPDTASGFMGTDQPQAKKRSVKRRALGRAAGVELHKRSRAEASRVDRRGACGKCP